MRKRGNDRVVKVGVVAGALVVVAVIVASATLGANDTTPGPSGRPARPAIELTAASPIRLRGTRFEAGERVRVTVDDGSTTRKKVVTAGPAGAFVVSFASAASCSLTVTAVGDKGSRASFQSRRSCADVLVLGGGGCRGGSRRHEARGASAPPAGV